MQQRTRTLPLVDFLLYSATQMSKLRTTLMLGVVVIAVVGAAAGIFVVERDAPGAWRSLVVVDAGLIVALAVAVQVLLSPTMGRLDDLVEALRALARGERQTRVQPDDFAGLADVARAVNDVAASLCENDDPNLGPVKKVVRSTPVRRPISDSPRPSAGGSGAVRRATLEDIADAPAIGEVRPSRKPVALPTQATSATAKLPAPVAVPVLVPVPRAVVEPSEPVDVNDSLLPTELPRAVLDNDGVSEPRPSRKALRKAKKAARNESVLPQPAMLSEPLPAPEPELSIAVDATLEPVVVVEIPPVAADVVVTPAIATTTSQDTIIEPAPEPELPTRDELRRLFDEFLSAKRAAGQSEGLDVDFDAFADTISSESERLVQEHQCRGVRFEIAVAEGEVSLRPRLIR